MSLEEASNTTLNGAETYLMTCSYSTTSDSTHEYAGRKMCVNGVKQAVELRVTNRLRFPVTPDHLQSVSFSIPGLHIRLNSTVSNAVLFHYGHVQVYRLPSVPADNPVRGKSASNEPPLASFQLGEEVLSSEQDVGVKLPEHGDCLPSFFSQFQDTPADSSTSSTCTDSDEFHTCSSLDSFLPICPFWRSACGSPPQVSSKTLTSETEPNDIVSVDFKGRRFMRILTPGKVLEDNVEASWTVSDFTECGDPVFSLQIDFIRPKQLVPRWMKDIAEEENW